MRTAIGRLAWPGLLALLAHSADAAGDKTGFPHRHLDCVSLAGDRARDICGHFERQMEWTWMGHATAAPGWRVTWETDRKVWCGAGITAADIPVLQELARSRDWRLEGGANALLQVLRGDAAENSIFNRDNPSYLLRGGCPKE